MIGHTQRFYSTPNLQPPPPPPTATPPSYGSSPLYALTRMSDDVHFDLNRNSLPDRKFYHNSTIYNPEQKPRSMSKSPFIMRNSVVPRLGYSPYPYKTSPERIEYSASTNNLSSKPSLQLEHVGGYCAEFLNRDKHYWTEGETGLMLELYEENRNYFNDSKTKKTKLWNVIANIINKKFNANVNSEQCSQKYRNLKAEFLKIADPTSSDGGAKKFGLYFNQMKRLIEAEEKCCYQNVWQVKEEVIDTSNSSMKNHNVSPDRNSYTTKIARYDTKSRIVMEMYPIHPDKTSTANANKISLEPPAMENAGIKTAELENKKDGESEISKESPVDSEIGIDSTKDANADVGSSADPNSEVDSPVDINVEVGSPVDPNAVTQSHVDPNAVTQSPVDQNAEVDNELKDLVGDTKGSDGLVEPEKDNKSGSILEIVKQYETPCSKTSLDLPLHIPQQRNNFDAVVNQYVAIETKVVMETDDTNDAKNSEASTKNSTETWQTYAEELGVIFKEYSVARNKALEIYEQQEKENILCMNKCVDIFRKVLNEKLRK